MFVHKYQPCPVSISLDYAGPQVSVAVIIVTIIAVVYCCVLHLPPPQGWAGLLGRCVSFMPGLLCGSNLERARGILDDRSRGDICVVCCWGLVAVHMLHPRLWSPTYIVSHIPIKLVSYHCNWLGFMAYILGAYDRFPDFFRMDI